MIVTTHFNILLYMKCGTHYILEVFNKAQPELTAKNPDLFLDITINHIPASHIPLPNSKKPTAIVCRNVWDWYVSRYFFMEGERKRGMGVFHPTETRYIMPHIWKKHCGYGVSIAGFKKHLPFALEYCPLGKNYFRFMEDARDIHYLKFENLAEELKQFIMRTSPAQVFIPIAEQIEVVPKINVTNNRPSTNSCYTANLIDVVYRAEADYISRFGQDYIFHSQKTI